jgi:hypothetical protein
MEEADLTAANKRIFVFTMPANLSDQRDKNPDSGVPL